MEQIDKALTSVVFFLLEKRALQQVEIYLTSADMSADRFCSPRQIHVQPYLWIDFVCINTASEICQQGAGLQLMQVNKTRSLAIFNLQSFVSFWRYDFYELLVFWAGSTHTVGV